jgi:hypothetical protein
VGGYGVRANEMGLKNSFVRVVACIFSAAVTFLPSRCLVTVTGYTYRKTD